MRVVPKIRRLVAVLTAFAALAVSVRALGTGGSFLALDSTYQQELYGVTQLPGDDDGFAHILGGVAFAPDGDVWSAECSFGFAGTTLHRFDAQLHAPTINSTSTLHPETVVATAGGCGLTNHPDGFIYANSALGVVRLNANTGLPAPWFDNTTSPHGPAGNALGITADPKTPHVIYVGAGCHPSLPAILGLPAGAQCDIEDLDPATGIVSTFAALGPAASIFIDGIYFDPTGAFLFVTNRDVNNVNNFLTVLRRPEDSVPNTGNPQLVQSIPTASEPDGVAFHAASPKFVVTNDEDGETMTAFTFAADDYTSVPAITGFASGGHRGDLVNVGADGCIYATQGRQALATDSGTRYDDGTVTTEDSLVRICAAGGGGFAPGVGVKETVTGATPPLTLSCPTSSGQLNVPYSSELTVTGGVAPYVFSIVSGALPPGLSLDTTTGAITGTPAAAGPFTFTWQVVDASGQSGTNTASKTCTITIAPPPLTLSCPTSSGQLNVPYSSGLMVTGGVAPYVFSIVSGALPPGLSLNTTTGAIAGTPAAAGPFTFTWRVVDASGQSGTNTASKTCTIIIAPTPPPPGKTLLIGPSSMEGHLLIRPGDWVNGGYSFVFVNGSHAATTVTVSSTLTLPYRCADGTTGSFVINLGTHAYAVPAGDKNWQPTGDANSVLSWAGAGLAPAGCGSGVMDNSKGAIWNTTISQNPDTGSLLNWRFKYRDPNAKGKGNVNCLDLSDPRRAKADVCGASWSETVKDP